MKTLPTIACMMTLCANVSASHGLTEKEYNFLINSLPATAKSAYVGKILDGKNTLFTLYATSTPKNYPSALQYGGKIGTIDGLRDFVGSGEHPNCWNPLAWKRTAIFTDLGTFCFIQNREPILIQDQTDAVRLRMKHIEDASLQRNLADVKILKIEMVHWKK